MTMLDVVQQHKKALQEDPLFPALACLMDAMEQMVQEHYEFDTSMTDNHFVRAMVSDHGILTLISMICAQHEMLLACEARWQASECVEGFGDIMEMTAAVYDVATSPKVVD